MNTKDLIDFINKRMNDQPGLFMFRDSEPQVNLNDINEIENRLSAKLPNSYIEVLRNFGGGTFAFGEIFSISPDSDFYVLNEYKKYKFIPSFFYPISSDGSGGYYGFIKDKDIFKDEIYYLGYDLNNIQVEKTKWNFIRFFMWSAFNIEED